MVTTDSNRTKAVSHNRQSRPEQTLDSFNIVASVLQANSHYQDGSSFGNANPRSVQATLWDKLTAPQLADPFRRILSCFYLAFLCSMHRKV